METSEIITQIDKLAAKLYVRTAVGVEPAAPGVLSSNLLFIRGLLVQLVDRASDAERSYRHAKAARFDKLLQDGVKKSPAMDLLKMEKDLIDMEIEAERLKGYMKYTDGLCTSVQSVLRVQAGSEKSQY